MRKLEKPSPPPKVIRALDELVKKLKKLYGDVEVYLFGSYAKGEWLEDSDIDIIVISKHFEELSLSERYRIVRSLASKKLSFEILTYTPREFEIVKDKSIVIQDAMKYWIKLT